MALLPRQIGGVVLVTALVVALNCLDLSFGHESHAHHHHCDHGHHHHHHEEERLASKLLPEELAEEEDMRLYGFGFEHDRILDRFAFSDLSGLGTFLLQFFEFSIFNFQFFVWNVCLVAEKMCGNESNWFFFFLKKNHNKCFKWVWSSNSRRNQILLY